MARFGDLPSRWWRLLVVATTALALVGCGATVEKHPYDGLIRQMLADGKDEWTRGVLERALEAGKIERADYLEDKNRELRCLRDNGLLAEMKEDPHTGRLKTEIETDPSDADREQLFEVFKKCSLVAGTVAGLYGRMEDNPRNAPDTSEADTVVCLKAQGLVPDSFTEADYGRILEQNGQDLLNKKFTEPHYPEGFTLAQKLAWDKCAEEASFKPPKR